MYTLVYLPDFWGYKRLVEKRGDYSLIFFDPFGVTSDDYGLEHREDEEEDGGSKGSDIQ